MNAIETQKKIQLTRTVFILLLILTLVAEALVLFFVLPNIAFTHEQFDAFYNAYMILFSGGLGLFFAFFVCLITKKRYHARQSGFHFFLLRLPCVFVLNLLTAILHPEWSKPTHEGGEYALLIVGTAIICLICLGAQLFIFHLLDDHVFYVSRPIARHGSSGGVSEPTPYKSTWYDLYIEDFEY